MCYTGFSPNEMLSLKKDSFATISLENGGDIKTVSENPGHATVAFALDVHGHVTDKMRKGSANRDCRKIFALRLPAISIVAARAWSALAARFD